MSNEPKSLFDMPGFQAAVKRLKPGEKLKVDFRLGKTRTTTCLECGHVWEGIPDQCPRCHP